MAVKVRDRSRAATRFQNRAAGAVQEYVEGVEGNTDWAGKSQEAQANYDAGVQEAVSKKSFSRGVQKAGQQAFTASAKKKGETRYPQGVSDAGPAWQDGVAPFLDVVAALTLPPRKRRGDPANLARVAAVAKALHDKKQSMKGG